MGEARAFGNAGARTVGIASTATGNGYWLLTTTGAVLPFGDAPSLGSPQSRSAAIVQTPSGNGYWIAAPDGRTSAFGDAAAVGAVTPTAPIIAMSATALASVDGRTYAR